jgi:hypothetical protein
MREWTESELTSRQRYAGITNHAQDTLKGYQEDLDWYATDEVRLCWTVENLFEIPVIYIHYGEWEPWIDALDDDLQEFVTVDEGTITGREAGDLIYHEP